MLNTFAAGGATNATFARSLLKLARAVRALLLRIVLKSAQHAQIPFGDPTTNIASVAQTLNKRVRAFAL